MEFRFGAHVYAAEGKQIGKVDRVVIDAAGAVHGLVVHKGLLLPRDILVDAAAIDTVEYDGVYLKLDEDAVKALPDFVEEEYALPPPGTPVPVGFPLGGVMYPQGVDTAVMPYVVGEDKRLQYGEQDIARGYEVRCADGPFGVVRDVLVDSETNRLDALIIEAADADVGTIRVPAGVIAEIGDEVVTLSGTGQQLLAGQEMR